MLQTVKLKKKWFKNLELLYRELGLIVKEENGKESCNPSNVYINPKDEVLIRKTLRAEFKKRCLWADTKQLDTSVALHMLNLGPNTSKAIVEGYIIIDKEGNKNG